MKKPLNARQSMIVAPLAVFTLWPLVVLGYAVLVTVLVSGWVVRRVDDLVSGWWVHQLEHTVRFGWAASWFFASVRWCREFGPMLLTRGYTKTLARLQEIEAEIDAPDAGRKEE